jgi:Amt family ammonium transporter
LALYAQKILPLQGQGSPPGYELLLRALDETHENRAPASLFSAAQRYQMECAIDAWVIEYALAEAARYREDLLAGQISLSINISAPSLIDEAFLKLTKRLIERSRLVPSLLTFEITETAAVSNAGKALVFIREMRAMGCCFALDDFGTGVNSFNCLKSLPVDRVKIDGSFVTDLLTNPQSAATVRAISGLAREMGIETVAEYAEDASIITRLRELGIDYAQGYGVEKPRPFSESSNHYARNKQMNSTRCSSICSRKREFRQNPDTWSKYSREALLVGKRRCSRDSATTFSFDSRAGTITSTNRSVRSQNP